MHKTSINELNAFLKGEHMAIDSYEKYIRDVDDEKIKGELQKIQQDHKQHAIKIAEEIQNLGGKPEKGVGASGKIAEVLSNVKKIGPRDSVTILKDAYDGENMGINLAAEIVKGDLESKSSAVIKDILDDDRDHLQKLNKMIENAGGIDSNTIH
jgi:rubrerythrin